MRITVLIPTLNEAASIELAIASCHAAEIGEVVVADGGSTDGTSEIAARAGAVLVHARPGRGHQLRAAAAAATGEVLIVLHADSRLPKVAGRRILAQFADPRVVGGAFHVRFLEPHWRLHIVAFGINMGSCLGRACTGDQAQWWRRSALEAVGGVPDVPLFEDLLIWRYLGTCGRRVVLADRVMTSGRRFLANGALRTLFAMQRLKRAFRAGASLEDLAKIYAEGRRPADLSSHAPPP